MSQTDQSTSTQADKTHSVESGQSQTGQTRETKGSSENLKDKLRSMTSIEQQTAALTPEGGSGGAGARRFDMKTIQIENTTSAPTRKVAEKGYGSVEPSVNIGAPERENCKLIDNAWKIGVKGGINLSVALRQPPDKIDIKNADDARLNATNAALAVEDLTPDPTWGFAPRTRFYSSALSEQHEMVHVADYQSWTEASVAKRLGRLEAHPNVPWERDEALAIVMGELNGIEGDLIEKYAGTGKRTYADCQEVPDMAAYAARPGETHAFLDGKPHYQALADGIAKRFNVKVTPKPTPIKTDQPPSPTGASATTSKEGLIAYVKKEEKKLVEALLKNDTATVNDLVKGTEAYRPLPPEVSALLEKAWAEAIKVKPPNTGALAAILGLRFGTKVTGDGPPDHYIQAWDALGRLPAHHVESPDAKKNTASYKTWEGPRVGDEDPMQSLELKNGAGGGQAGGGKIEMTQDSEMANRNRFRRDKTSTVNGAVGPNSGTLPNNLGGVDATKEEELRKQFEGAGITNLSHSMLHEMGHGLDRSRGIMDGGGYNFPNWKVKDQSAPQVIARELGLEDDGRFGPGQMMRPELEKKLGTRGPDAVIASDGVLAAWTNQLKKAKESKAGQWLTRHGSAGARAFQQEPIELGGRVYMYNAGDDSKTSWTSYDLAYRTAHSVSDYQWKTHREYFAECYAVYYDSKSVKETKPASGKNAAPERNPAGTLLQARDPAMKAKLDELDADSKITKPK